MSMGTMGGKNISEGAFVLQCLLSFANVSPRLSSSYLHELSVQGVSKNIHMIFSNVDFIAIGLFVIIQVNKVINAYLRMGVLYFKTKCHTKS